jgi:peptide/nickel transport system permease protein
LRHRFFVLGLALLTIVLLGALLADLISPASPTEMRFRLRFRPPHEAAWLGTDAFGRDILSRVLHGARLSLLIAFAVMTSTGILGVILGVLAGYFRRVDNILMRVMDALMAFPAILLAIAISAALGPSIANAIIALTIVYTPRTVRVVRASVLMTARLDYVEAARTSGAGSGRVIMRHILPNSLTPLIVQLSFIFAYAILAEAILSFLGVGPPPPTPTWGNMIAEGKDLLREAFWMTFFPGIAILVTTLSANFIGDGLRDALDPRMPLQASAGS